jgi:dimethylargininase
VSDGAATRLIAITQLPSPRMQQGERTFVGDERIDPALALRQHEAYRNALRRCGAEVIVLDANLACPDGVFVEDTAIVLDDVAVMMSMGAASRRGELPAIEAELARWRPIARVRLPATIDGGDIVRAGRALYVGRSPRTNDSGIAALRSIVAPFGYTVTAVPVTGCLHLKTACSALPDGRFLINADWIDTSALAAGALLPVANDEPWAGDVLVIGDRIIVSDAFPQTAELVAEASREVIPVSVSEFAKAEGGVTCLSLVFPG